jgi:acetate kinase
MGIFGLRLDENQNKKNAREIGWVDNVISVEVIESDEDGQIARHVHTLLRS